MEFVDTHCHLNHPDYAADGATVRARAQAAGVTRLLCIGYDLRSSRQAYEIATEQGIYAAVGIHPESAHEWNDEAAAEIETMYQAGQGKVAAYGEIGLDYHWNTIPHSLQQTVFEEQIAFAASLSPTLPLIIHTRNALGDTLALLGNSGTPAPVVMHCFTGDTQDARLCLDAGYYLGIGGVATFKKSDALRAAIAFAPLERLLLETDSPYLAPQLQRGRRNEPSYLPAIAEIVATAQGLPLETVAAITTATACALFGMV